MIYILLWLLITAVATKVVHYISGRLSLGDFYLFMFFCVGRPQWGVVFKGRVNKGGVTVRLDLTWTTLSIYLDESIGAIVLFGDIVNMAIPRQFWVNVSDRVYLFFILTTNGVGCWIHLLLVGHLEDLTFVWLKGRDPVVLPLLKVDQVLLELRSIDGWWHQPLQQAVTSQ